MARDSKNTLDKTPVEAPNAEASKPIGAMGEEQDSSGGVQELIRRMAAVGLSGFFTTETALRKALGDTLPKEWVDFAAGQSERTRHELLDRLAGEFGKVLEQVELTDLMDQLLTGRTVEVTAQIRLGPPVNTPVDEAGKTEGPLEDSKFEIKVDRN